MQDALEKLSKEELITQLIETSNEVSFLKEELAQLKRLVFGKKSERFIPTNPDE